MNNKQREAMWKQIKDGPAGWVIRMREQHGATFKMDERSGELIWTGCKCDGIYCPGAPIWLAHIDDLKEAIEQKQRQFAQETLRASKAESERDAALAKVGWLWKKLSELGQHSNRCALVGHPFENPQCTCGLKRTLNATSATAQQFVEKVRREALEEAWDRTLKDVKTWITSAPTGAPVVHFNGLRAAILGEKEKP